MKHLRIIEYDELVNLEGMIKLQRQINAFHAGLSISPDGQNAKKDFDEDERRIEKRLLYENTKELKSPTRASNQLNNIIIQLGYIILKLKLKRRDEENGNGLSTFNGTALYNQRLMKNGITVSSMYSKNLNINR